MSDTQIRIRIMEYMQKWHRGKLRATPRSEILAYLHQFKDYEHLSDGTLRDIYANLPIACGQEGLYILTSPAEFVEWKALMVKQYGRDLAERKARQMLAYNPELAPDNAKQERLF